MKMEREIKQEQPLLEDYTVIDLEMTGLHVKTDRILEVGAVRVRGGRAVQTYGALLYQERPISEQITELTGITDAMAKAGRDEQEVMTEFLDFIGEDVLVGQNVIFDYSFLKQWAVNHNLPLERSAADTLKLARSFLPKEEKKDLESLCRYFGIVRANAHRALDDAYETYQLFEKLKACFGACHPNEFAPKPLCYQVKKQTPATARQKEYLREYAAERGLVLPEELEYFTRAEASRLLDQWILQYGKR